MNALPSGEAKIKSEARARLLNVALPVIAEIIKETREEAIGALCASFRGGEDSEKRSLHEAKLCALEELEAKFNAYAKGGIDYGR